MDDMGKFLSLPVFSMACAFPETSRHELNKVPRKPCLISDLAHMEDPLVVKESGSFH